MDFWIFIILLITVCRQLGAHSTGDTSNKCEKFLSLAQWRDHNTVVDTSLKTLAGSWISESCETRPGPEYLLRFYNFKEDGSYNLFQHHYWDDSCSLPKMTLITHGRIQLTNSLVQPGAATGFPKPINISLIPQDDNVNQELRKLVSQECQGHYWKPWKRNEEHVVFDHRQQRRGTFNLWSQVYQPNNYRAFPSGDLPESSGDISCLGSVKWAFNELRLIKIQFRPPQSNAMTATTHEMMEMELLLGDIHSNKKRREFYSSTSFQAPLLRQTKGEVIAFKKHGFSVKTAGNLPTSLVANVKIPPHLMEKPHLPPYIWGEWTSSRCEIRPMDVYLLRHFSFYHDDSAWIGEHKFYSDPFCIYKKFVVTAAGHLRLLNTSREMPGTTDVDFHIESAFLTVMDYKVVTDMRLENFCGIGQWKVNFPKDLGPTNGCIYLGIFLPSVQYDIVKLEMDYKGSWLLSLGQVETNNLPNTDYERPTAFQLPLVKCGDDPVMPKNFERFFRRRFYFTSPANNNQPDLGHVVLYQIILYLLIRRRRR